jgi:hypothetical protein
MEVWEDLQSLQPQDHQDPQEDPQEVGELSTLVKIMSQPHRCMVQVVHLIAQEMYHQHLDPEII